MKNSIAIRSWLRKSSGCESRSREVEGASGEESVKEEGSTGGENGTSSMKEEDHTSEDSSSDEVGASDKRAP
jgi:hypothetical protein